MSAAIISSMALGRARTAGGPGLSPDFPANTLDLAGSTAERLIVADPLGWAGLTSDCSYSCFYYADSLNAGSDLVNFAMSQMRTNTLFTYVMGVAGDGALFVNKVNSTGWSPQRSAADLVTIGQRYHIAASWRNSINVIRVWLDGLLVIDTTGSITNIANTSGGSGVGGEGTKTYNNNRNTDGYVCQVGVWNGVIEQAEVDTLATGVFPETVLPGSCIHSYPVDTDGDPLVDRVGALPLQKFGATTSRPTIA